jgi:hypothetical protein
MIKEANYLLSMLITLVFWELDMTTHEIAEYLSSGAAAVFKYGVIEGTDVVAFGVLNEDGTKVRLGSISEQDPSIGYCFLVLSIDNTEEYRADTINQVFWFMWALDHFGDWDVAALWVMDNK